MITPYQRVLEDLEGEHAALERVLTRMSPAQWDLPTHAPGWLTRHQVAHLAIVDDIAVIAMRDEREFRSRRLSEDDYIRHADNLTPAELLADWQRASKELRENAAQLDETARLPWYGPDMSATSFITARLMECWGHGLDVVDVVDIPRPDTVRLYHVAFLGFRTRAFSYVNRKLPPPTAPVYVEVRAPSGATWQFGEPGAPDRITGTATDFCRVVTQRRHLDDTALVIEGAAALEWMTIAQAFAGPPGRGRAPGEFAAT